MKSDGKLLIIDRTDIRECSKTKKATEIGIIDLKTKSHKATLVSDVVLVVFETCSTVILKNRWGTDGVVVSKGSYESFLKPKTQTQKPFWRYLRPFNMNQ